MFELLCEGEKDERLIGVLEAAGCDTYCPRMIYHSPGSCCSNPSGHDQYQAIWEGGSLSLYEV